MAQVIVLSHDNSFLREMWDRPLPTDNRKALNLVPCGHEDTVIVEWNIEEDTEGEDAANKRVLRSFLLDQEGEPRDVVQKIRPVVETHMVRIVPELNKIPSLGDKLAKIQKDNSPPALLDQYDLIDDLNAFTRKYMHGEGRNPDATHLCRTELEGWVRKTLILTGSLS